ncbi:unnamed protein product [Ectocarpus sp. 4 AP-2014]
MLLLVIRHCQAFVSPSRQASAVCIASVARTCCTKHTASSSSSATTAMARSAEEAPAASGRVGRPTTLNACAGAGGENTGEDVRQRAQDMHSTMTSEGKDEMRKNASREAHNRRQAAVFDSKVAFFSSPQATPKEQFPSLRRIAEACRPSAERAPRVVDAGCGTGALVSFLKEAGVKERDVTGVDVSPEMGVVFKERFPESEIITAEFVNYADEFVSLRERLSAIAAAGDGAAAAKAGEAGGEGAKGAAKAADEEDEAGGVGTVVFNAVFGNLWDQGAALERSANILEEGGKVVISHPLGRDFVSRLKAVDDTVVPHELPERDALESLVQFLPLVIDSFESGPELYLAVLRKTPHRASGRVRYLRGTVSTGYGRGSKKLGVPTANLPESQFAENLRTLPTGVYFGWAALEGAANREGEGGEGDASGGDCDGGEGPWKCVANVGYSPTFAGQENAEKIVEGHLIGYEGEDFYGRTMRMLLAGFQRREKKFASFPELVATINKDVRDAAAALDEPRFSAFKADAFFTGIPAATGELSKTAEAWSTRDFEAAVEEAARGADK